MNKEAELAACMIEWLKLQHWECYQEVAPRGGKRADIVATRGPVLWAIECKMRLTTRLLEQAEHWLPYAHFVSVAVAGSAGGYLSRIAALLGIGTMSVWAGERPHAAMVIRPQMRRQILPTLKDALREEHKSFAAAGNNQSVYFTPWKGTAIQVTRIVSEQPGLTIKEVVDIVKHHYSSDKTAYSGIYSAIMLDYLPGVMARREGRLLKLYPCEVKE